MKKVFFILIFSIFMFIALWVTFKKSNVTFKGPMKKDEKRQEEEGNFRVMTMNCWMSGSQVENGAEKIAKHIKLVDPDIVTLQEMGNQDQFRKVLQSLGTKWKASESRGDEQILTKHKFVEGSARTLSMRDEKFNRETNRIETFDVYYGSTVAVRLFKNLTVNVFSLHLDYRSYGPYAAFNKMVRTIDQIMLGEQSRKWKIGRAQNIKDLLASAGFKAALKAVEEQPLIASGDFNCPSHLDWTEEAKDVHGGWVVEWPATKMLAEVGMIDSFRQLNPNVTEEPGNTWSTIQKASGWEWDYSIPEPQDRIDFIHYKSGADFKPVKSYTYSGSEPLKPESEEDFVKNDYPSDHFAVVTEFVWNKLPSKNNVEKRNKGGALEVKGEEIQTQIQELQMQNN